MKASHKSICIIGAFRKNGIPKGGQEVKTHILAEELERIYHDISRIDTFGKLNKLQLLFRMVWAIATNADIIILPAHKGFVVESVFLRWMNVFFHRRLHYVVIGGWLAEALSRHKQAAEALKHFTGIYVETTTMYSSLCTMGYSNVLVLPNCKPLHLASETDFPQQYHEPYKLLTFSRVTEKKGIADAIAAVNEINQQLGRIVYTLDIYGSIDPEDREWFSDQQKLFTPEIRYAGYASFEQTGEILSNYFALLFPTHYFTEGIPGTIIDTYAAGVPVVSAQWKSFQDVVEHGVTGYGYAFGDQQAFVSQLLNIAEHPELISGIKVNCLRKAKGYLPHEALKPLLRMIEN